MGLRDYLEGLDEKGLLKKVEVEVSKNLEISGILKAMEPTPVMFNNVKESDFRVVGNVFCTKNVIASYFNVSTSDLIPMLSRAILESSEPEVIKNAPCQEIIEPNVDLDKIPILFHCERDGGNYISSAVVVTKDPDYGQNLDLHRAMQFSKDKFATRIVQGAEFSHILRKEWRG